VRLLAILAVFALVATLAPGAAQAQAPAPAPVDSDARTQAAGHVRQGQAYFERHDFDRALVEYQTALNLSGEPSLIFNIALCHDRANRPEEALRMFLRYLELAPGGSVAEEARGDIARLTPIVEKIRADRAAEQARQREDAARRAEADRRAEAALRAAVAANRRARLARYLIVGGAMVAGAGGVTYFLAHQHAEGIVPGIDPAHYLDVRSTALTEQDIAYGAYAVGGVALATGLVLALTARGTGDGAQLSAAITPGGATLSVAWSR
jgi:tetratricopeptide (TPR) repeat protein